LRAVGAISLHEQIIVRDEFRPLAFSGGSFA
jgi:hypothetical protein